MRPLAASADGDPPRSDIFLETFDKPSFKAEAGEEGRGVREKA